MENVTQVKESRKTSHDILRYTTIYYDMLQMRMYVYDPKPYNCTTSFTKPWYA